MSVGQGGSIFVGSYTNLPETVRMVEAALAQLRSVMGNGLPNISLGSIETGALNQFQQAIDAVATRAENRIRDMQANLARTGAQTGQVAAGYGFPAITTAGGNLFRGTQEQLSLRIREQALQEMNVAGSAFLRNAPALMKTIPIAGIMESTLQNAIAPILAQANPLQQATPLLQAAFAGRSNALLRMNDLQTSMLPPGVSMSPTGVASASQPGALKQLQQMIMPAVSGAFLQASTAAGVASGAMQQIKPGVVYDPGTQTYIERANTAAARYVTDQKTINGYQQDRINSERLIAAQAELAAGRAQATSKVIKIDQPYGRDPVTGLPFPAGMVLSTGPKAGNEVSVGQAQEAAGQLYKSQMKLAQEYDKLAIQAREVATGQTRTGKYAHFTQGWVDPDTGKAYGPGTYMSATGQIASPLQQAQYAQRYQQTPIAAFLGGFTGRGFNGGAGAIDPQAISNLASTAGTVAKYSLLYNVLFKVTGAMGDMLNEAKNMSDSMRDLSVAIGGTEDPSQQFINDLSAISRLAGSNVGEAMDTAARGIRMFRDEINGMEDVERVGTQVAFAASQIALITSKTLPDAAGDINAIASAYGLNADAISTVVDAISGAKNEIGGLPAQVSQGLANVAQSANEAGFQLNEAAAAIALVQGRTDQSGQAVATRLSRVFAILGGTTGRGIITTLNQQLQLYGTSGEIDPDASVRDQFEQIANAYKKASPQLQGLIRSALGGSSNTKELIPILNNPDIVFGADFTAGTGLDEFKKKSEDLVGTLRKIGGSLTNIQTGLVQSNIFAPFAVGLKIIEPLTNALDKLLQTYNKLTDMIDRLPLVDKLQSFGGLSGITTFIVEMVLLRKAFTALGGITALKGFFSGFSGAFKPANLFGSAGAAAQAGAGGAGYQPFLVASRAQGATGRLPYPTGVNGTYPSYQGMTMAQMQAQSAAAAAGARVGVVGRAGSAIGGILSKPLAIIGLIIGAQQLAEGIVTAMDEIDEAAGTTKRLVGNEGYLSLVQDAKTLRSAAAGLEEKQGGPSSFFVSGMRGDTVANMNRTAQIWEDLQKQITAETDLIAKNNPFAAFGDFPSLTVDEFNARLETLKTNGETATSTLAMVNKELLDLGKARVDRQSPTEAAAFAFQDLMDSNAPWMLGAAQFAGQNPMDILRAQRGIDLGLTPAAEAPLPLDAKAILDALFANTTIAADIGEGLTPFYALRQKQDGRLTEQQSLDARAMIGDQFLSKSPELQTLAKVNPALVDALVEMWTQYIMQNVFGESGVATLTADMAAVTVANQLTSLSAALGQTNSPRERLALIRETRAAILNTQKETPGTPGIMEAVASIEKDWFAERATNIEALARSEASRAGSQQAGNAILTRALRRVTGMAARRGYEDKVVEYFNAAGKAQVKLIMAAARETWEGAQAKHEADMATYAAMGQAGTVLAAASTREFGEAEKVWKTWWRAYRRSILNPDGDWQLEDPESDGMTKLEARRAAEAARVGGSIVPAQMELKNATDALRKAKPNSIKYFQALAEFYDAQRGLRDAIATYRDTQYRLGIDLTNPLAIAGADLKKAKDKLAADIAADQAPDVIAQDKLDVQNAQNAQEATKFSQRLQRVQTAEQLGRISHAAYIRYLDNERDRLGAIKNKSYQQWQQLNEVDQALKAARDSMNGQFNLGDIKIPTPYEVKRYIATTAAGLTMDGGGAPATQVNVYVDGELYAQKVLSGAMGGNVLATAGTSKSKSS